MINCKYVLVAENVLVDSSTNATSLINVLNNINVPQAPISVPWRMIIHTHWEIDPVEVEAKEIELVIKHPDGSVDEIGKAEISPGAAVLNQNFILFGLKVKSFGVMTFEVKIGEEIKGSCSLLVQQALPIKG